MQRNPTIATSKIIMFVAFISVAIITSLFVYHLRGAPKPSALNSEEGIVFPVARDIKSFELVSMNQEKFSQTNFYNHWTLLFFGFTHCSSVCPTTLEMMSRAYGELSKAYPNLQVVLVSLDPERDKPETLVKYTRSFNPNFIGVSGKIGEVRKLQSQLGVYSALEAGGETSNYQIQHTSSIMLINPQGKWTAMYKYGLKPDVFVDAVKKSIG